MRISDWSSDVCSSDLALDAAALALAGAEDAKLARLARLRDQGGDLGRTDVEGGNELAARGLRHPPAQFPPLICRPLIWSSPRRWRARRAPRPPVRIRCCRGRSEERRVGKEVARTCGSRWSTLN